MGNIKKIYLFHRRHGCFEDVQNVVVSTILRIVHRGEAKGILLQMGEACREKVLHCLFVTKEGRLWKQRCMVFSDWEWTEWIVDMQVLI